MKKFTITLSLIFYASSAFPAAVGVDASTLESTSTSTTAAPDGIPVAEPVAPVSKEDYTGECLYGGWPRDYKGTCPGPESDPAYIKLKAELAKNNGNCAKSDWFLCNPAVYGGTCVKKDPVADLSQRCSTAASENGKDVAGEIAKVFSGNKDDDIKSLMGATGKTLDEICADNSPYMQAMANNDTFVDDCKKHKERFGQIREAVGLNDSVKAAAYILGGFHDQKYPPSLDKNGCYEKLDAESYKKALSDINRCDPDSILGKEGEVATDEQKNLRNMYIALSQISASSTKCVHSFGAARKSSGDTQQVNQQAGVSTGFGFDNVDIADITDAPDLTDPNFETQDPCVVSLGGFNKPLSGNTGSIQAKMKDGSTKSIVIPQHAEGMNISIHTWKEEIFEQNAELMNSCDWVTEKEKIEEDAKKILAENESGKNTARLSPDSECGGEEGLKLEGVRNPRCLDLTDPVDAKIAELLQKKKQEEEKDAVASAEKDGKKHGFDYLKEKSFASESQIANSDLEFFDANKDGKLDDAELGAMNSNEEYLPIFAEGDQAKVKEELNERLASIKNPPEVNVNLFEAEGSLSGNSEVVKKNEKGEYQLNSTQLNNITSAASMSANPGYYDEGGNFVTGEPSPLKTNGNNLEWENNGKKYSVDKSSGILKIDGENTAPIASRGLRNTTKGSASIGGVRIDDKNQEGTVDGVSTTGRAPAAPVAALDAPADRDLIFSSTFVPYEMGGQASIKNNQVEFLDGSKLPVSLDLKTESGLEYYSIPASEKENVRKLFERNGIEPSGSSTINIGGVEIKWNNGKPSAVRGEVLESQSGKSTVHVGSVTSSSIGQDHVKIGGNTFRIDRVTDKGHIMLNKKEEARIRSTFANFPNATKATSFYINNLGSIQFLKDGTIVLVKK